MNEKEIDMNELIECFKEYSLDFNKTTCKYYEDYLRNYQKEKIWQIEEYQKAIDDVTSKKMDLEHNWNELKKYISSEWYCFDNESTEYEVAKDVLDKMTELERGEE